MLALVTMLCSWFVALLACIVLYTAGCAQVKLPLSTRAAPTSSSPGVPWKVSSSLLKALPDSLLDLVLM